MAGPRQGSKCALACNHCRIKKAKCSGNKPCQTCLDHNEECWYPEVQQRPRKRKDRDQTLDERFARLESMIQASRTPSQPPPTNDKGMITGMRSPLPSVLSRADASPPKIDSQRPFAPINASMSIEERIQGCSQSALVPPSMSPTLVDSLPANFQTNTSAIEAKEPSASLLEVNHEQYDFLIAAKSSCKDNPTLHGPISPQTTDSGEPESSLPEAQEVSEFQGPASYLSICSEPAIDWVSDHFGVPDFANIAKRLTVDILQNQKLTRPLSAVRTPEPDYKTAWCWITAYFERGLDTCWGGINRIAFEQRLRLQFQAQALDSGQDIAWYALRNIIYATGCRIALSEGSQPFAFNEAREQAWGYFENALSVHTELVYARSGITAIQALLAMAFYAEGLGSPALEFMLLSNATRLAQSKGLHLEPSPSCKLREEDLAIRRMLWWTIYAYDKHLSYREGRPSAIDDDNITCALPSLPVAGGQTNMEFLLDSIRHAQINSLILSRLTSAKAMKQSPEDLLIAVQDLEQKLQIWYDGLAPIYRSNAPLNTITLPHQVLPQHLVFMRFSYRASLIAVHSVICHPWSYPRDETSWNPGINAQKRARSAEIVAEASRDIIMATKGLTVSAASPVWLTFYFPLVGLINLFLHVIQYPDLCTVPSDISLMEVIVGHFGYLGFASRSDLTFQFPRKIVSFAREVVKRARKVPPAQQAMEQETRKTMEISLDACADFPLPEFITSEASLFGFDDWNGGLLATFDFR